MKRRWRWLGFVLAMAIWLWGGCLWQSAGVSAEAQAGGEQAAMEPVAQASGEQAAMEPVALVDDGSVAMTVLSFEPEGDMGPQFAVRLENRTDEDVHFALLDVSINDVMVDPMWGEHVAARSGLDTDIHWFREDLTFTGINYVQDVEGELWVYSDSGDVYRGAVSWRVAHAETDIPPAVEAEFPGGIDDIELSKTGEYVVTVKTFGMNGAWGPSMVYYLENRTDAPVMFCMEGVKVNGKLCQPLWSPEVGAGKVAYSHCDWFEEDVQAAQIDRFETVEFTLTVMNPETGERIRSTPARIDFE